MLEHRVIFPSATAYKEEVLCFLLFPISLECSSETSAHLCSSTTNWRWWRKSSPAKVSIPVCFCVCMCKNECTCFVSVSLCAFVLWCCSCLAFSFSLLDRFLCACACTVIKPEVSPSHLTSEEHEVEKDKEEEQIQLLLKADGWPTLWKYVINILSSNMYVFIYNAYDLNCLSLGWHVLYDFKTLLLLCNTD